MHKLNAKSLCKSFNCEQERKKRSERVSERGRDALMEKSKLKVKQVKKEAILL